MSGDAEKFDRPVSEALDAILGQPIKVLDDGFVRVVDYMGADESIVQAARVSYGKGTKKISEDRGLIRYLLRHRHTTPFEMAEIKLHVRVPMDCWRQWIRHRTACLAEGTELYFDLPGGIERRGDQLYKVKIEDLWDRFQPTRNTQRPDKQRNPLFKRDRVRGMQLRQVNEDTHRIQHTRIVDVFKNGVKPVFHFTLEDGKTIEATADHRFLFAEGWSTFGKTTGLELVEGKAVWRPGDYQLHVNGMTVEVPANYEQKPSHIAWNKLTVSRPVRVVKIKYVGEKMTYDVEVEGPYHNFVANGIVTHNSVNEYSTRYSIAIDASQQTPPDEWRLQSRSSKQGSGGFLAEDVGRKLSSQEEELQNRARSIYQERLDHGVAREQARKDLPLSTYTEAYWKINLHNLFHFLSLRMDDHAQLEIRDYARTIGEKIVAKWVPIAWEAFQDYRQSTMGFSRIEIDIVAALGAGDTNGATALIGELGWLKRNDKGNLLRHRERNEFETKLTRLNIAIPWRE